MTIEMKQQKSLFLTYVIWAIFGWAGLHHFYLRRDRQAFVWWSTWGGFLFLGWFRDLWRIPDYVDDANDEKNFMEELTNKMKARKNPKFNPARFIGQLMTGFFYGSLVKLALPVETPYLVEVLSVCFGMTTGVHMIGNIGREQGGFWKPYFATLACYYGLFYFNPEYVNYMYCVVASALMFNQYREYRRTYSQTSLMKRIFVFLIGMGLMFFCVGSFLYFNAEFTTDDGEQVKFRDSVNHFFKSPAWLDFKSNLWELYEEGQRNGWGNLYDEIVKSLDPKGEANALKVLGVNETSSKEDIKKAYKTLVRKWHPDRYKGDDKKEAEKKFMEIQGAYEILSGSKKSSEYRNE